MEVPRLGFKLELLLPAYARATAMPDLSHDSDLHHSWILNPLSKSRNQTLILVDPSRVGKLFDQNGNSLTESFLNNFIEV